MPKLKLSYFDFDGGRGEPARLALHIGGIAFEDHRVAGKDWPAVRDQMPLQAMPVLEIDGRRVTQSNAINRYVGRLAGLYPQDALQALLCDEAMDAAEDIGTRIAQTMELADAAKKQAREALAAGRLARFLEQFQAKLQAAGGEYFADGRLTIADLKVSGLIRWLRSGALDHLPKDLVEHVAPLLVKHHDRVANHPKIAEYYRQRKAA